MKKKQQYEDSIYLKYIAEECKTFDEIIEALKANIEYIEFIKNLGCKVSPVDCGHIFFSIPTSKIDEYCKEACIEKEDLLIDEE